MDDFEFAFFLDWLELDGFTIDEVVFFSEKEVLNEAFSC